MEERGHCEAAASDVEGHEHLDAHLESLAEKSLRTPRTVHDA